jgi:hypothetical protein
MSVRGECGFMKLIESNKGWRSLECLFTSCYRVSKETYYRVSKETYYRVSKETCYRVSKETYYRVSKET